GLDSEIRATRGGGGAAFCSGPAGPVARITERHCADCGRYHVAGHARSGVGGLAALKLLLDTHVWVWSLVEPSKLSRRTVRILRDPKNQLWLSSISLWEVFALIDRGRIRVEG